MARPPKFNKDRADKLLLAITAGNTKRASCASVGISEDTLDRWLKGQGGKNGKDPIEGFAGFAASYARAEADAEVRNAAIVNKAGQGYDSGYTKRTTKTILQKRKVKHPDGTVIEEMVPIQMVTEETITEKKFDWRASAWWLERRSADWRPNQKVEVSGENGDPVTVAVALNLGSLTEAELDRRIEEAKRREARKDIPA